ncbi:MAG: guanylate kinase [Clostridiales Family XIII bacterium]|jgi:guanylate kinase|nr:guanylate kinase [Clostridiales Family XIII bacterium]
MKKGKLFVISGPSAVGKGTLCKRLLSDGGSKGAKIELSVSMTTRKPRFGEKDGKSYYFVTEDEFRAEIGKGGLLEYAEVFGCLYGTPKEPVLAALERGSNVLLEIDVQGALQVRENHPDSLLVFILPPSLAELRRRIRHRGSETAEQVAGRLSKAVSEISAIVKYDYAVVNNHLGRAVAELREVIEGRHARLKAAEAAEIAKRFAGDGTASGR